MRTLLFALIISFPSLLIAQGVRVDIPLWTSGPNVPTSGGALPQSLLLANAKVSICVNPAPTLGGCTPVLTYTDKTLTTPCPPTAPIVQLPGSACLQTTGTRGNLGFWYAGGVVDYWVQSSYGTFGPFTTSGGTTGPTGPANTLIAGPVTTLPSGSPATVTITGSAPIQTLTLGIPQGSPGSGTISGQATGVLPLAGSATTITAQSHLDDGVTKTSTLTSSENVNLPTSIASGQPILDIRHPSFSGGAICDGTTAHPIDAALQAAWNAIPTGGGRIRIVASTGSWCYWANPTPFDATINPTGFTYTQKSGPITMEIQGIIHTGTTVTVPNGIYLNQTCINGTAQGAQFQGPGDYCQIILTPASGATTGTVGSNLTPTYTGSGSPTASVPVVCNSSVTGATYQDTAAFPTKALFWTCEIDSGSISSVTNPTQLTVGTATAFVPGELIWVTGAGTSGGILAAFVKSISGSVITLDRPALTTVSGAVVQGQSFPNGVGQQTNGWLGGAVWTFTPSGGITNIFPGTGMTLVGPSTVNISTITRTSNIVTVTTASPCPLAENSPVATAGVTDSSFNGSHSNGPTTGTFLIVSANQFTCTFTYKQTAANASSSSGTITATNEATIEDLRVMNTSGSTVTVIAYRPHVSTDQYGLVGLDDNTNGAVGMFKDISYRSSGTGIWLETSYETVLDGVAVSSAGPCNGVLTEMGVDIGESNYIHMKKVGLNVFCSPYTIHMQTTSNLTVGSSGPLYIEDSFLYGGGIKIDHGAASVVMTNTICDQCGRGVVTDDVTTPFWNGVLNVVDIRGSAYQDNPQGFNTCWAYVTAPVGQGPPHINLHGNGGVATCSANEYLIPSGGSLTSDGPAGSSFSTGTAAGPAGVYNDGRTLRGRTQVGLGTSVVPYATANIDQTSSSWTGSCTKTTGVYARDGTSTAISLTNANALEFFGSQTGLTPAVGDMILYWAWAYTPTANSTTVVPTSGGTIAVDNSSSTHFQINYVTNGGATSSASYESVIPGDSWHLVTGFVTVTQSDGTGSQVVRMSGGCSTSKTITYWAPGMIYIPASSGIPLAEVLSWRQDLLNGPIPPNWNNPGVAVTSSPLASVPPTTTLTGTAGTAVCSQGLQGTQKYTSCYLNAYANTSTAQTYTFPTAYVTTGVLLESGGSCGTYNPSTTATVLTLPANAAMTSETCNIIVLGQ